MGRGLSQQYLQQQQQQHISRMSLIVLIFVTAILTDSLTYGQVNVEPNTALLNENDRTELLCRYGRPISYCRIEIPGEDKVFNLSPEWSKTPGFTYYGAGLNAGQCGVSIDRVKASNNGQVKCSLGAQGEELSGTIDLVVAMRPQQPLIELLSKPDRDGFFAEGTQFSARCIVGGGRPAANITWLLDDLPANKRVSRLEITASPTIGNVELSTSMQEIQWHLGAEDSNRKLVCRSHHQTDRDSLPPQEGAYVLNVRYQPIRQPETLVYGLYLEHTAFVNLTIRASPQPRVEWTVDGAVIPQGSSDGRFSAFEPQYLGNDYYNVTLAIAGLSLEDTTKTYNLRASNGLGATDYQVRISSSSTPPTAGLDIAAIVGIVVAIAVLVLIVLLILFARATGRWCFGGKSIKSPTNETSDTESADIKATSTATATTAATTTTTTAAATAAAVAEETTAGATAAGAAAPSVAAAVVVDSHTAAEPSSTSKLKSKRLPSFAVAILKRFNEKEAAKKKDNERGSSSSQTHAASAAAAAAASHEQATSEATDGNDNEPKEDKQLVYAELVLKPAEKSQPPAPAAKNATEYAEIVYVQKPNNNNSNSGGSSSNPISKK